MNSKLRPLMTRIYADERQERGLSPVFLCAFNQSESRDLRLLPTKGGLSVYHLRIYSPRLRISAVHPSYKYGEFQSTPQSSKAAFKPAVISFKPPPFVTKALAPLWRNFSSVERSRA